jgi:hypothetical protein
MRINLKTPFAEKDAVKALGARWDAAKKLWYITDVADLTPFLRWIPDEHAATESPMLNDGKLSTSTANPPTSQSQGGVITKPTMPVSYCSCSTPPWIDCEHSASRPLPPLAQS